MAESTRSTPVPSPPGAPGLGIARALGLLAIIAAVSILVVLVVRLLPPLARLAPELLIIQIVTWPLVLWLGLRWTGDTLRAICPLGSIAVRSVPWLVLASFGAAILLIEVAGWIPMPAAFEESLRTEMTENRTLMLFGIVLIAPVAEEVFFRGLLLRAFRRRYSLRKAIWATAAIFAVFHLNPWQAVVALPLGLAYAWLVVRTGSLIPPIVSHAVVNLSANVLLPALAGALGYDAERLESAAHIPTVILGIALTSAVVGCAGLWRTLPGLFARRAGDPDWNLPAPPA